MKILLPIDQSKSSEAAIQEVSARTWPARSIVRVLSVIEPLPLPPGELWYDNRGSLEAAAREIRKTVNDFTAASAAKLRSKHLRAESIVREGHARTTIVDEAG